MGFTITPITVAIGKSAIMVWSVIWCGRWCCILMAPIYSRESKARGVFRSPDNGQTWEAINDGLTSLKVLSMAIKADGTLFAGTDLGVYRFDSELKTWVKLEIPTRSKNKSNFSLEVTAMATSGSKLFVAISYLGFLVSEDNGVNWDNITTQGSPLSDSDELVLNLFANASGTLFATFATLGIYRYNDGDSSWQTMNNGFGNISSLFPRDIIEVVGNLYVGTLGEGVFRSNDNATWVKINGNLADIRVISLAVATQDTMFVGTNAGVFCSTDGGATWTAISQGLNNYFISSLVFGSQGHLFAGTAGGWIYRSVSSVK